MKGPSVADVALYKLEKITDNSEFEGFGFVREKSLRGESIGGQSRLVWDFGSNNIESKGRAWTVPPLAPVWTPQRVVGRVGECNDYPCVNLTIPAFSRHAVDSLRQFLEPNGELLPLVSEVGEYFAYNIRAVADILNPEKSVIKWANEKHVTAIEIERYECFPERMAGLSIFLLVEKPTTPLVTQIFVDRVRDHGLQGFIFIKLWPLAQGVSWKDEARKERKKGRKTRYNSRDSS